MQYFNSMFISRSLHILRLLAEWAASMTEFSGCTAQQRPSFARYFWGFLFSPCFQEPISNLSVEMSPAFLTCFHITPYLEFNHLIYWFIFSLTNPPSISRMLANGWQSSFNWIEGGSSLVYGIITTDANGSTCMNHHDHSSVKKL